MTTPPPTPPHGSPRYLVYRELVNSPDFSGDDGAAQVLAWDIADALLDAGHLKARQP